MAMKSALNKSIWGNEHEAVYLSLAKETQTSKNKQAVWRKESNKSKIKDVSLKKVGEEVLPCLYFHL